MTVWRPRCFAQLSVPVMGDISTRTAEETTRTTIQFELDITRCMVIKNNFNTADECEIMVTYDQIGADPRLLGNAVLKVWLGNANDAGPWSPTDNDLQFAGIVTTCTRNFTDEKMLTLRALDYTTLFLAMKPFPDSGAPDFTMTLRDAWTRICDHVGFTDYESGEIRSSVEILRTRITGLQDGIIDTPLGKAQLARVAKNGKIVLDNNSDGWSVWRQCVDMLGLISWIDGDQCFVSSAEGYYTSSDPPVLMWGKNISAIEESRDLSSINNKGVHLVSFDIINHQTIEAFFPDRHNTKAFKKRVTASNGRTSTARSRAGKGPITTVADAAPITDYEQFEYNYVATQELLDVCAQRVWEERSRQELQGHLTTGELQVETAAGDSFDLLQLAHGDQIQVALDQASLDEMRKLPTALARYQYLIDSGYSNSTALLISSDQGFISRLQANMYVKTVHIEYDAASIKFEIGIDYLSRINPNNGSADLSN